MSNIIGTKICNAGHFHLLLLEKQSNSISVHIIFAQLITILLDIREYNAKIWKRIVLIIDDCGLI